MGDGKTIPELSPPQIHINKAVLDGMRRKWQRDLHSTSRVEMSGIPEREPKHSRTRMSLGHQCARNEAQSKRRGRRGGRAVAAPQLPPNGLLWGPMNEKGTGMGGAWSQGRSS